MEAILVYDKNSAKNVKNIPGMVFIMVPHAQHSSD